MSIFGFVVRVSAHGVQSGADTSLEGVGAGTVANVITAPVNDTSTVRHANTTDIYFCDDVSVGRHYRGVTRYRLPIRHRA